MIRSLNTAEQAMKLSQLRIDALANNLANVNSSGFRQILMRVAEAGSSGVESSGKDNVAQDEGVQSQKTTADGIWAKRQELEMYHALDNRIGPIHATGRDTDVALMGKGFFVIQTEAGERFTRNGSFQINAVGQLATSDGKLVLSDGGPINLEGKSFNIQSDGKIIVDGNQAGRFKIVDFEDPSRLENLGGTLLMNPEDMPPQEVPSAEVVLASGHLEGSNVNPIDTLVAMIAAQRAFELQSQVMTTENELLGKAVNNLPHVGN